MKDAGSKGIRVPGWYDAMTLPERLRALRRGSVRASDTRGSREISERRLQRWSFEAPLAGHLAQSRDGETIELSPQETWTLLGEAGPLGNGFQPPPWYERIDTHLASPEDPDVEVPDRGLLNLVNPLIEDTREALRRHLKELVAGRDDLPFDEEAETLALQSLYPPLSSVVGRTLVLEMHVSRLQGELEGETPEERYKSFTRKLRDPAYAREIHREYPVLTRLAYTIADHWLTFVKEFFTHLAADWEEIRQELVPGDESVRLKAIRGDAGDRHRRGRTVLLIELTSGVKLVYKPRSLAVERHFQELLSWVNEHGAAPGFRILTVLDKETHGWVEFVEEEPCRGVTEVRDFYRRQGGYLALLYALEATDFHYENLIASGADPVLIDLEALFHPRVRKRLVEKDHGAASVAAQTMAYSVLRVGLLPQKVWNRDGKEGVDISGLGGAAGQLTPMPVPTWDRNGTDEMCVKHKHVSMAGGRNRASLEGSAVQATDYVEEIVGGFESLYGVLLRHRDELLADDGPLQKFADDEIRVILRPTRVYFSLLNESFHPDVLRNAVDRDCLIGKLSLGEADNEALVAALVAEIEDLRQGDIPLFSSRPGSLRVWPSEGEPIEGLLDKTSLEIVADRLLRLSQADLERQSWFVRASLASLSLGSDGIASHAFPLKLSAQSPDRDRVLRAAEEIGDRLLATAVEEDGTTSWLGLSLIEQRHWQLLPVGVDLYNGLPGITLFLAYLGHITGEPRFEQTARGGLRQIQQLIEQVGQAAKLVGGFSGLSGVAYAYAHLGALWSDPALIRRASELVEQIHDLVDEDEALDVISGSAGCIGVLAGLHRRYPHLDVVPVIEHCARRLVERAAEQDRGVAWLTEMSPEHPLTGFSHGTAGFAWALLQAHAVTGEQSFKETALQAFEYERHLFDPAIGNWPDLRDLDGSGAADEDAPPKFMLAWCHGAPGIGLGRLAGLEQYRDEIVEHEIRTALATTLRQGFGHNHSLCHGDLGNLELLLAARDKLGEDGLDAEIHRLLESLLASIESQGWLTGIPRGVESPGLMTGLSGIGYGLLRFAETEKVPSVLLLEPPKPVYH